MISASRANTTEQTPCLCRCPLYTPALVYSLLAIALCATRSNAVHAPEHYLRAAPFGLEFFGLATSRASASFPAPLAAPLAFAAPSLRERRRAARPRL